MISSGSQNRPPSRGFPLGEPPLDDVDGAARLFLQYEREAPLDRDHSAMFLQMCGRPRDVIDRVTELRAQH